jgi:hypothetical protein
MIDAQAKCVDLSALHGYSKPKYKELIIQQMMLLKQSSKYESNNDEVRFYMLRIDRILGSFVLSTLMFFHFEHFKFSKLDTKSD